MKYKGVGTEQVEKSLLAILPQLRVMRIDADTTRHKGSHQKLLKQFGTGKADVLIGTQMIAKGLHFPSVTLVGVLNSDAALNLPDFRASETVFQLISQVAGRAGRGSLPGELIIQTHLPENSTIRLAASQDFVKFFEEEIKVREQFLYPPFAKLAKLTFSGTEEGKVSGFASAFRTQLLKQLPPQCACYPVVPAGYAKVKDNFRFQLLLRGPSSTMLSRAIQTAKAELPPPHGIRLLIDINPVSTL
jgi:primosomal protein N' (replication factor Y)